MGHDDELTYIIIHEPNSNIVIDNSSSSLLMLDSLVLDSLVLDSSGSSSSSVGMPAVDVAP